VNEDIYERDRDAPFRLHLVPDAGGGDVGRLERWRFDAVLFALERSAFLLGRLVSYAQALGRPCSNGMYL
jgi:hypothetical protein